MSRRGQRVVDQELAGTVSSESGMKIQVRHDAAPLQPASQMSLQKLLRLSRSGTPEKESPGDFIRSGGDRLSQCWHPAPRDGPKSLDVEGIPAGRRASPERMLQNYSLLRRAVILASNNLNRRCLER